MKQNPYSPDERITRLKDAQRKAELLFATAIERGYVVGGVSEKTLNRKIHELAHELFGVKKYWHKRIVRAGANTLSPYREHPPDLVVKADDILFFDFGPVFEEWEADVGRTYVLGSDPNKLKLQSDVSAAWHEGKSWFSGQPELTGAQFYAYSVDLAKRYGWEYGGPHCGHLIGNFPHERIQGDEVENYIHPDNHMRMAATDSKGGQRHWIYEIHFVDRTARIGGFFEQLLTA